MPGPLRSPDLKVFDPSAPPLSCSWQSSPQSDIERRCFLFKLLNFNPYVIIYSTKPYYRFTIGRLKVPSKRKYRTVSLPSGVADAIQQLIDELGFWPSVGAFAREACIKMIREEWPLLGKDEEPPVDKDPKKRRRR